MKKTIRIEGMSCGHCVQSVTDALKEIKGISEVAVSLEEKIAVVEAENVDDSTIKEAIDDIGFDVVGIE